MSKFKTAAFLLCLGFPAFTYPLLIFSVSWTSSTWYWPAKTDYGRGWSQVERKNNSFQSPEGRVNGKLWQHSPFRKIKKRLRRLLASRLRESIIVSSFLGIICGFQSEIRVVWGLTFICLADFHRFPFLPCGLTFLGLNICVFNSLRILPFYISVQPVLL